MQALVKDLEVKVNTTKCKRWRGIWKRMQTQLDALTFEGTGKGWYVPLMWFDAVGKNLEGVEEVGEYF